MPGKRERRKRAEAARREQELRRRRRHRVILIAGIATAVLLAAGIILPGVMRRQERLSRVVVHFPDGTEAAPFATLQNALENTTADGLDGIDGTIEVIGSLKGHEAEDADVTVELAEYGSAVADIVAADPFVLIGDRRAGSLPLDEPANSLEDLSAWLASLAASGADSGPPFVVAGENDLDFAGFILYLAGELLDEGARARVRAALKDSRGARDPAVDEAELESLIGELHPVIRFLEGWKQQGILAFNWSNWDRIAVRAAHREGTTAVSFQPRSEYKSLGWENAFHLRMRLPPLGPERRLYSMTGRAVVARAGEGPRSDAIDAVRSLLRASDTQAAVEVNTTWSPVRLEGTPINREHRDVVRWIDAADEYIIVDDATAAHPLFRRVHQLLR